MQALLFKLILPYILAMPIIHINVSLL